MREALAHNLVALARSASLTRRVISAAEAVGLTVRIRQVRSVDSMCRMVARGLGLAVLPRAAADLFAQALGLAVIKLVRTWSAGCCWRCASSRLSPAALALVEMIATELLTAADA